MARLDKHRARYGRYSGGPDPLAPPVDLAEALDSIGQDVMAGYSPERAMQEFLRRGGRDQRGLDDLARRVAERRRDLLQRHNLDGTLQEVRRLLDEAVQLEKTALFPDPDDDARFREAQLDALPSGTAAAVRELAEYDWRSDEARGKYEEIRNLLGQELMESRFQGMKQTLQEMTPEDTERIRQMMADLNDLLLSHLRGDDTTEQFQDFMRTVRPAPDQPADEA